MEAWLLQTFKPRSKDIDIGCKYDSGMEILMKLKASSTGDNNKERRHDWRISGINSDMT